MVKQTDRFKKTWKSRVIKGKFNKYTKRYITPKPLVHFFKRTVLTTYSITNSGFQTGIFGGVNQYRLDSLPNYTEFTNLYDTYKICGIKHKFIFDRNSADSQAGLSTQSLPNLLTIKDYNDATAPASENEMLQYPTFKVNRLDRPIGRYFRPCQDIDTNNTNIVKSRWNPTSQPDIEHRGIKVAITVPTTSNDNIGVLKIYTTYYLAMRTPK